MTRAKLLAQRATVLRRVADGHHTVAEGMSELAAIDEQLAEVKLEIVSEFSADNRPPGMARQTFNTKSREMFAAGDPRVRRVGRKWFADRSAFVETAVAQGPQSADGYSLAKAFEDRRLRARKTG